MMKLHSRPRLRASILLTVALSAPCIAEQVPFRQAIDLALKRSGVMAMAEADRLKAQHVYLEVKNAYIPAVTLGSGLGYSFGVPQTIEGTAPSIFNVTSSSTVLNFPLRDQIKAAKVDWKASDIALEDKRNGVILDTAVAYIELDSTNAKLKVLREQQAAASKAQYITQERVKEGLDPQIELSRAKLLVARVEMRIAEAEGTAELLREKLSKLTGIATDQLETVTETLPATPDISQSTEAVNQAIASSPAIKVANQKLEAAELRVQAEQHQMRPQLDFYSQYSMLAKYNNFDEFYRKYSRNNYTLGAGFRFPLFNRSQSARVAQAGADRVKAKTEAEELKNQIASDTLKLLRSIHQLTAAKEVARLEYELSQANVDEVQAKISSGQGNARDQQQARLEMNDKYAAYLDTSLELYKAQMQYLRAIGEIQQWAIK